jgi:hypothetical protein
MAKQIPKFESEDEERAFWAEHDSTEYVDWEKARPVVLPKLRRRTATDQPEAGSVPDEDK